MNIKRRSVIKGAAWSIPVIAAAIATPLAAASTQSTAELRFIGSSFTKKSLKFKVQNTGSAVARDVSVLVIWDGGTLTVPLGDIAPGSHAPTEHDREHDIPDNVSFVSLEAVTIDGSASAQIGLVR